MRIALIAAALCAVSRGLPAQSCSGPHYRWSEKTTLSLAGKPAVTATVHQMLTTWGIPSLYAGASSTCTDRTGRELNTYAVRGWACRVIKDEADGDWHIEITAARTGAVANNCVVVEIPGPDEGRQFRIARDQFDALVADAGATIRASNGDLSTPVRMKFVGPAFSGGEHRGARGTANPPHGDRHGHGRCNGSTRALWEIHPVYGVFAAPVVLQPSRAALVRNASVSCDSET